MSEVDFDRLADFVGGALDGTPDADQIRARIAGEPEWAAAYQDLLAASDSVTRALQRHAEHVEPMPSEVTARLHAAIISESQPAAGGQPARPGQRDEIAAGTGRKRPPDNRPQRRRSTQRRRHRWLAILATTAVLAGSGMAANWFLARGDGGGPTMTRGNAPAATALGKGGSGHLPIQVASGRDYDPATLSTVSGAAAGADQTKSAGGAETTTGKTLAGPPVAPGAVPPELGRLSDQQALLGCLAAVVAAHPGTVSLVDYARFQGAPALLVVLTEGNVAPGRTVVVVGPDCGLRSGWSDERYPAKP